MENKRFLTAQDVMEMLGVSLSYSYKLIRRLNAELEAGGFVSMPFLFCMFSPFKKCSFLVKKILLIKQCIDSFLFFFHEFFPFF